jgi:IS30 family transposase
MKKSYTQLQPEERATLMLMLKEGTSLRAIARHLQRSPSSLSRELARQADPAGVYSASAAGERARTCARQHRRHRKLGSGTVLFGVVEHFLREDWSPEQIAGTLRHCYPADATQRVSHETIYQALYGLPRGAVLRTELLGCLRQGRTTRRRRARGQDRRGHIIHMTPIHARPPVIEDRVAPGHWEGDLIKGAFNRSAVGTLVERTSRLVRLVKLESATALATLAGFSRVLNDIPAALRHSLTYDQGKEMSEHQRLTALTGVPVFFADPHSPWQRGSNENANGLLRQYLPKGTDLAGHSQTDLDAVAAKLNNRPRKILGFRTPLQVYHDLLAKAEGHERATHLSTVALGA